MAVRSHPLFSLPHLTVESDPDIRHCLMHSSIGSKAAPSTVSGVLVRLVSEIPLKLISGVKHKKEFSPQLFRSRL